jgi:hypothetical protein
MSDNRVPTVNALDDLARQWQEQKESLRNRNDRLPLDETPTSSDLDKQVEHGDKLRKQYGFPSVRTGALRYDWDEIERQIDRLIHREIGQHRTDGTMPDKFVGYVAVQFLSMYCVKQKPIPQRLLYLIAELLETRTFGLSHSRKPNEKEVAWAYAQKHPDASQNQLAKEAGVSKTTIHRWQKAGILPAPKRVT